MAAGPTTRRLADVDEDRLPDDMPSDYRDGFEVCVGRPDTRSAEQWARASLEEVPWVLRRLIVVVHRKVLRLRLGPLSSPDHVLGWRIASAEPDEVRLEAAGPLIEAVIIGRRTGPEATQIRTFVGYRRPAARGVWAVIGPLHRRVATLLLRLAAKACPPAVS